MTIQKKTLFQRGDESLFLFDGLFSLVNNNQFRSLPWQQNKIRVFGREYNEPRLTCYFGPKYTYSNIHWPESPMHPIVQELFNMVCEASEFDFNAVLCNFYRNGADSMGWHADNEKEIDQKFIGSVSFGGTRKIHFRNLSSMERFSVELKHGDFLLMHNFQKNWQHAIFKQRHAEPRYNLTFRKIS